MAWQQLLMARWQALAAREKRGVGIAAALVAIALVWSVALAPALRTLKGVEAQRVQLERTAAHMQALQARARLLQARPASTRADSLKALQEATAAQGKTATLQVLGEQATVTLRQANAAALAGWLAPAAGARPSPAEAHLQRDAGGTEALWSGALVFHLPDATPARP